MIPYFVLLFIPLLLQTGLQVAKVRLRIGKRGKLVTAQNIALPMFFVLFSLLLALRNETIGRDLANYKYLFASYGITTLSSILSDPSELVFHLYCWFIYNFVSQNYQLFLAITAFLTIIPMARSYNKDKSHGYLKIAVFVNMSTFIMVFSGIRQGLAMAAGMLAYQALVDNKLWRYFVWTVIAAFTHHTGFMLLFLLPLCKIRFRKKDLLWIIPCGLTVVIFNRQIFNVLSLYLGEGSDKYGALASNTGAFGSLFLFVLFTVFCYVIADETRMDGEAFALRNILTFAAILQSFALSNSLAMRMNYYFILLIPMAIGKSLESTREQYWQVAKVGEAVICVFFTLLFVYGTYQSYVTGISTLDTIPYVPFWKG